MRRNFVIIICLFISTALHWSCQSVKTIDNTKKTGSGPIYNPYIQTLHPQYFVHNPTNEKSRLYIKLNLSELKFTPIGENKSYISKMKITYKIYPEDNFERFSDSASVAFEIKKRKGETSAITYITLDDKGLKKFFIQIETRDLFKQTKAEEFILVNRENPGNSQDFLINLNSTNYPYFSNFFSPQQSFTVNCSKSVDNIYIRYFSQKVGLPLPPFSSNARAELFTVADSSWIEGGKSQFQFAQSKPGLYYFQIDSTLKYGLGLLNCGLDFPYLKKSEELIYPLEYLLSPAEFAKLKSSTNKKLSIDRFWLDCGKNPNKSRELIRIYYSRVFYANVYFTSFTEGWKTDRGMIYIVLGPPKSVQKAPNKETWFYFDKGNTGHLQFVFKKFPNQYSENDYVLDRHIDFKRFWDKAIDSWKSGKVYNVFD